MARNTLGVARNGDFTILWVGQTISELGSRVSMFVFPLLTWQLSHSAIEAALVETLHLIGLCGTLLPAGVLADRTDRQRLMRISSGSGVVLYASLVLAGALGALTVPHLAVVALLTGVSAGLFSPAETSAVRSVVPDEQMATALSQIQARQHLAGLLGGPIGGLLFALTRWLPFAADAVSYAVAWLLLGRIRTDLGPAPDYQSQTTGLDHIREGMAFTMTRPFFRTLLIWAALVNLTINALFFVATLRLIRAGYPPVQIGLVETAAALAGILGALAAPSIIDRFATGTLTVAIAWSWAPVAVPLLLWNKPSVVAAALAAGMFLNPAGNAGISAYRLALTPHRLQGRVSSASRFLAMSVMPLSPILGGAMLTNLGAPIAIAGLGALTVLTVLTAVIVTLSPTIRSVPRPAIWQTEFAARQDKLPA